MHRIEKAFCEGHLHYHELSMVCGASYTSTEIPPQPNGIHHNHIVPRFGLRTSKESNHRHKIKIEG